MNKFKLATDQWCIGLARFPPGRPKSDQSFVVVLSGTPFSGLSWRLPPGGIRCAVFTKSRAAVGFHPILNIESTAYDVVMKNCIIVSCVAMSLLAISLLLVGCDRTVSSDKSSTVSSDGTVKTKEKTVTKSSDGTVTKTEETRKTEKP